MSRRDSSPGLSPDTLDRRSLIKRALAAGSVGYVAPMILGSATPASAQVISAACSDPSCETPCGPADAECFCVSIVGGGTACIQPICTNVACTTNADCGADSVCFTQGCCDDGAANSYCIPLCGAAVGDTLRSTHTWRN